MAAMAIVLPRLNRRAAAPKRVTWTTTKSDDLPAQPVSTSFAALREAPATGLAARADSIVAFGLSHQGTPYVFAGTSPLTGFDCSGFIMYTFAHFNVNVPHSTALLIDVGRPVARAEAQPGDIVVFTGTAPTSTTPGHAGIVISKRGEVPLRFVHASSARRESGVKVSQVEGTDYERRFMQVRRVLGPGAMVATNAPKPAPLARTVAPVAALPTRPAAVEPLAAPVTAPPKVLPALKKAAPVARKSTRTVAKKAATRKSTVAKKKVAPTIRHKAPAKKAPVKKTTRTTSKKRTTH
ncbi:hypothetical protein AUC43_13860 [Hymenobacter sedentarius]|uniref:NlpC/P60 domain-containing protein n=2 Tax=Hymenobacter sedentarius TaxID=1411621 RepID=A0A0U4C0P0_9BACT|nr:hypothetical protein AUC43_13860 [Hymenobacter sedentarius]